MATTTATKNTWSTGSAADERKIWDFLMAKIGNAYGVAGLMGNLYAESALRSYNLQQTYEKSLGMTDTSYTNAVDNGTYTNFVKDKAGYGLVQWTYHSRKQGLMDYCKSKGCSIGDLQMQLEYMWKELGWYGSVLNTLKNAKSVLEASNAVLFNYEAPADQGEAMQKKRAAYGQDYYDRYAKAATTATTKPAETKPAASTATASTYTLELPILKKGDTGNKVKALQLLLIGNGYSCGKYGADSSFGPATDEAVKKMQKANGITVDGIVGKNTMELLLK